MQAIFYRRLKIFSLDAFGGLSHDGFVNLMEEFMIFFATLVAMLVVLVLNLAGVTAVSFWGLAAIWPGIWIAFWLFMFVLFFVFGVSSAWLSSRR